MMRRGRKMTIFRICFEKYKIFEAKSFKTIVGVTGFEPVTSTLSR